MKSYSALKKNKFEPELNQRIESKLLITTISKQGTPNPSAILSRYDHLRHEEEFQKEYNLKFLTDRKRNTSAKKLSSTKRSGKETKRQKMGETVQPQRLFFEADQFKEKYYHLHQTHLRDKQKWISDTQKLFTIKESIYEFLVAPDEASASGLAEILSSQKISKLLSKFVAKSTKLQETQVLIVEIMKILQLQRRQDIIENLRARVQRFRNLDECTFKILELESTNRKVVNEFEERIKKMKRQLEENGRKQMERVREDLELCKRSKVFMQQQLTLQKEQYTLLLEDLTLLLESEDDIISKWKSGRPEVMDIHKLIRGLSHKLRDIEVQAEDNMFRLVKSNQDILKLQQVMSLIKDDMNKQLLEQEDINQQSQCEVAHLSKLIQHLEDQINEKNETIRQKDDQVCRIQIECQDELSLIASSLGLKESHSSKINLTLQQLNRELANARLKIEDMAETLKEKDELIGDMSKQMEKLSKSSSETKQSAKTALYQKQQYKFLLSNLRDQVCEMKKQHNQEIARILRQKDEQIVSSNRDILTTYSNLKEQHEAVTIETNKLKKLSQETKIEISFLKNKQQQTYTTLRDKQLEITKLMEENERYKKYLKEIENSFKQVVEMQQVSSKTVARLESENRENCRIIKIYQQKNQQLQKSNNELIEGRNQAKTEISKYAGDLAQVQAQRLKLQSTNVELRLETITKQNQINRLTEQLKNASKDAKSYKLGNEKLLGQLNSVTRKLVMFRLEMKKKYTEQYRQMCQEMTTLKQLQQLLKHDIQKQMRDIRDWSAANISQVLCKALSVAAQYRQKYESMKELSRNITNQHSPQNHPKLQQPQQTKQNELLQLSIYYPKEPHINPIETSQIAVSCELLSHIRKQTIVLKLYSAYSDAQQLLKQNQQLHGDLSELKKMIDDQCQAFLAWVQSQTRTKLLQSQERTLKRKDTPFFIELNPNSSLQNHTQRRQQQKLICNEVEDYVSNEQAQILTTSFQNEKEDQGQVVNNILQILAENDNEIPSVPYWKIIQTNFLAIRRKLAKKACNLKLDISAIDNKDPPQQSPHSINFGESSFFIKRIGSEPDDMLDLRQFGNKETNRSQKTPVQIQLNQLLRQENEDLREKLLIQVEGKAYLQQKNEELQMRLQQLQIKLVSLQNQTSIKGLEHNFKKLLDYLLAENSDLFEQTCRVIMKMLHFSNGDINDYEEKVSGKKKKKKGGLFASLFKN